MALPTPVEMPNPLPVNSKQFDLNLIQSNSPAGSQFLQTIERAPPLWIAKYSTPNLSPEREQIFQAFIDSLEGSLVPFLAFDPRKPRPWAYRSVAGEPWIAPGQSYCRVLGGNYAASTINLDRFAVGATITAGDYISIKISNQWFLWRAGETRTADGSGLITGLKVTPRPPTYTTTQNARLVRACCTMKMIGLPQKEDSVADIGPKYSFQAVQFKDRSS